MAKLLNQATTDKVTVANPYTIESGSAFTFCEWVLQRGAPANGQGTGKLGSSAIDLFVFFTNWFCEVPRFTTTANAFVSGANLFPSSDVWTFVGITYSESDGVRIYRGTLSTPMVELSYVSRTVGVGATLACDGNLIIGNRSASSTLAPRHNIAHVSLWDQILTVEHMNLLRIFPYAAAHRFSVGGGGAGTVVNLKSYHPLTESAAATALDHSGNGNNGTVTGMALAADPPFAWTRRGLHRMIVTPAAAVAIDLMPQASM